MSPSLKTLSGETQKIAQTVLVDLALSAPRLRTEKEKLREFAREVAIIFEGEPLGIRARVLLEETKP